jgi:hypothetical protein
MGKKMDEKMDKRGEKKGEDKREPVIYRIRSLRQNVENNIKYS